MKVDDQKQDGILILILWLVLLIVAIFFLPEWWDWDKIIDFLWNEPWEDVSNHWQQINNSTPYWPYFILLAIIGIGLFSLNHFKHLDSKLMMVVGLIMMIPFIISLVLLIINSAFFVIFCIVNVIRIPFVILICIICIVFLLCIPIFLIINLFSLHNAEAQYSIGKRYFEEDRNYKKAVKRYRKAAEQGFTDAQFYLGMCYKNGKGVEQDYTEAMKWYHKAAEQGNAGALYNLGLCYETSQGVEQDFAEAVKWYRKAAKLGNADAQYNVGLFYAKGQGVEQDFMEAIKWYRKAAEQGNAAAQNNLGWCYYYGQGVEQNYEEAVKWFNKATEQVKVIVPNNNNENEYLLDILYDIDAFDDYDYSQETWDAFIKGLYEDRPDDFEVADNDISTRLDMQEARSNTVAEKKLKYYNLKDFHASHGKARLATQKFYLKDGSGSFVKNGIGFGNTFVGIAMSVDHNRVKDSNGETLKDSNGKTVWEPNELHYLNHKALCLHILSHEDEYQVLQDTTVYLSDGSNPYLIVPKTIFGEVGDELE